MQREIWKVKLAATSKQQVQKLPKGFRFLHLETQAGHPCFWIMVDPDADTELVGFRIYCTGETIHGDCGEYLGTFLVEGGRFVGHVFQQKVSDLTPP